MLATDGLAKLGKTAWPNFVLAKVGNACAFSLSLLDRQVHGTGADITTVREVLREARFVWEPCVSASCVASLD